MKIAIASVLAGGLILGVPAVASATTLVDYGINDRFAGSSVIYNTAGYQAIGFNLDNAATLTGLSIYLDGLVPRASLPASGSELTWRLYRPTEDARTPGNVVYSGFSKELSRSIVTSTAYYDRMLFSFALPSLAVDAGFYYLAMHIDKAGAVGMVGSSRPDFGVPAGYYTLNGGRSWKGDYTQALMINGVVPEPATWGLMGVGFGLVGFAVRRRQRVLAII